MGLNRTMIGRSKKSAEIFEITLDKLRDAVTQFEEILPPYLDSDAARALGHPTLIAPPAFASRLWFRMVWAWPMCDPELGRKGGANLLLADLRTTHYRPVYLGDRLTLIATVTDIREIRKQQEIISIDSEISTEDGEPVCATEHKFVIALSDTCGEG